MSLLSRYPDHVNAAIRDKGIVLITVPENLRLIEAKNVQTKSIKTTRQLHEHILKEQAFWTDEIIKNNQMVASYASWLSQALSQFETMLTSDVHHVKSQLEQILDILAKCQIGSNTKLASTMVKHHTSDSNFWSGFQTAVTGTAPYYSHGYQQAEWHKGVIIGYGYKGVIEELYGMFEEEKEELANTATVAKEEITNIMARAEEEYVIQDAKYKALTEQANAYIKEKEKIIVALESKYNEKLAFEKPADDWDALSKKYRNGGFWWIGAGITLSIIIVATLALLIVFIPRLYQGTSNWFNIARDTALITVLTGVAVYALRIIFRLALSSFHLSRDARERHRLTKFYHAMVDAELIRDEERPLVIQSLFSRADTGLLKDSTPELPSQIVDIIDKGKPKNK